MQVSVIIPVYNAADFICTAVESALAEPETAEVILVEDNSSDDSLHVCETLAREYDLVRLYRHPDGGNHGAGASRNLGIRMSRFPYIAFLDADDFYLPDRFTAAQEILTSNPDIDGVYEAIGTHYDNDSLRDRWRASEQYRGLKGDLTTMTTVVEPEDLFGALVGGSVGNFSGDGLVVRRTLFEKTGLFDEQLRLHQDTAMWIKMAAVGRLAPGRLDNPVAMRRVHANNRILSPRSASERHKTRMLMWDTLLKWSRHNLNSTRKRILIDAYTKQTILPFRNDPSITGRVKALLSLAALAMKHRVLLTSYYFWKQYVLRMLRYFGLGKIVALLVKLRRWLIEIKTV